MRVGGESGAGGGVGRVSLLVLGKEGMSHAHPPSLPPNPNPMSLEGTEMLMLAFQCGFQVGSL